MKKLLLLLIVLAYSKYLFATSSDDIYNYLGKEISRTELKIIELYGEEFHLDIFKSIMKNYELDQITDVFLKDKFKNNYLTDNVIECIEGNFFKSYDIIESFNNIFVCLNNYEVPNRSKKVQAVIYARAVTIYILVKHKNIDIFNPYRVTSAVIDQNLYKTYKTALDISITNII